MLLCMTCAPLKARLVLLKARLAPLHGALLALRGFTAWRGLLRRPCFGEAVGPHSLQAVVGLTGSSSRRLAMAVAMCPVPLVTRKGRGGDPQAVAAAHAVWARAEAWCCWARGGEAAAPTYVAIAMRWARSCPFCCGRWAVPPFTMVAAVLRAWVT